MRVKVVEETCSSKEVEVKEMGVEVTCNNMVVEEGETCIDNVDPCAHKVVVVVVKEKEEEGTCTRRVVEVKSKCRDQQPRIPR